MIHLSKKVYKLERKVVEMSKFDIQSAIDKSVESCLKQIELPKGIPDFKKIKLEKAAKQNVPKTSWNKTTTAIYDQKSRLYRMMEEVKAFNNHPTHKDLYDALAVSLIIDEDDMDRIFGKSHQTKRKRDDHDKDPSPNADKDSKKRQKKLDSYKDDKDEAGSSKQGKSSSKPSKSNKLVDADEVNLLSLFEMIKIGTPCLETTSFNCRLWQLGDKVHCYPFPFPLGYLSYDSAVISEVPISEPNQDNSMLDNCVQEMYYSEQPTSILLQILKLHNAKFVAFQKEIDSLKFSLSKNVKANKSLMTTIDVLKTQSKEKEDKYIEKEIDFKKQIKKLENIVFKVGHSAQTMHMLTKPQVFYDDTHKQALGYQNPCPSARKISGIKLKLYAGEHFQKHFVSQKELSAEQEFWFLISNPIFEQLVVQPTPVKIEVPSELPKASLVNIIFQKLKNHLATFSKVVKERTTPSTITEGAWGFEHTKEVFITQVIPFLNSLRDSFKDFDNGLHDELNEVKTVFNQMEAAVEHCSIDNKCFEIKKKQLLLENDQLL
ncbi:hypothetical protein Tco_1254872 [Tanacetum coccineum]